MTYVKGFAIDWEKIKTLLEITDDNDYRIDRVMNKVMLYVDRDKHWLCGALTLDSKKSVNLISLGEDAFSDDLEKLDIPIPDYLLMMGVVLTGPKVFIFEEW